ncbi:MAG: GTP cyclohydrolase I FolE [Actinomycetia bacterium]|nr:GTP cyclohydrolase I FolE [Actinomycetes bacterium]
MPVDKDKIAAGVRLILEGIGEDPDREGLRKTPARVAALYEEICAGQEQSPSVPLSVTFDEGHQEMVLVRDIPLYSLCEHHMVPFVGLAHVAYIPGPDGRVCGLSKIARVVDVFARRLQVQERLTSQVADSMVKYLQPAGVLVVIEAEHLCMSMRGVKKSGSKTITSAVRGIFQTDARTRAEAMALIGQR